jgi:hypothetical protein
MATQTVGLDEGPQALQQNSRRARMLAGAENFLL